MSKKRKKKGVSLASKKARMGWVFVSPFVLGFFLFYLPIIIESIGYSFMEVKTLPDGGFETKFIGWANYDYVLRTLGYFTTQMMNSVSSMLGSILPLLLFSLFVAILLNRKMKGRTLFRAIFFVPVILSTGIIAKSDAANNLSGMFSGLDAGVITMAAEEANSTFAASGLMEYIIESFKFSSWLQGFVSSATDNILGIINNAGVQILIFLSGLQSISPSLYEAASMEGCSQWESFWKITVPMISPMILVNIIYTIVDAFTKHDNSVMTNIQSMMSAGNFGPAAAAGWCYFVIIAVLVAVIAGIASRLVFYQNRE